MAKTEKEIKSQVFNSYLKKLKGEKLDSQDKDNLEIWEKMQRTQARKGHFK